MPETWKQHAVKCPNCSVSLADKETDAWRALEGLMTALKQLRPKNAFGYSIRLQFLSDADRSLE
jgi:hypothetical protein